MPKIVEKKSNKLELTQKDIEDAIKETKTITIDKEIRQGKFIFKGTRITVQDIAECIISGLTFKDIEEEYPSINKENLKDFVIFFKKILEKIYKDKPEIYNFIKQINLESFYEKNFIENKNLIKLIKKFIFLIKGYKKLI